MVERDRLTRLWVEGVDPKTKAALRAIALKRLGKENVSQLLRIVVDELVNGKCQDASIQNVDMNSDMERIEIRLPSDVVRLLEVRAENRLSSRNYYLASLVYEDLARPQLQIDEIEVLRRSNYELAKIGTNLNQVARAFNLLVKAGGGEKLPEIGKKIAALRGEIKKHTDRVLSVLQAKTVVVDRGLSGAKARGRKTK